MEEPLGITSNKACAAGEHQHEPKRKRTKPNVKKACLNCSKSHLSCSDTRPCTRCLSKGIECVEKPASSSKRRKFMTPQLPPRISPATTTNDLILNKYMSAAAAIPQSQILQVLNNQVTNASPFSIQTPSSSTVQFISPQSFSQATSILQPQLASNVNIVTSFGNFSPSQVFNVPHQQITPTQYVTASTALSQASCNVAAASQAVELFSPTPFSTESLLGFEKTLFDSPTASSCRFQEEPAMTPSSDHYDEEVEEEEEEEEEQPEVQYQEIQLPLQQVQQQQPQQQTPCVSEEGSNDRELLGKIPVFALKVIEMSVSQISIWNRRTMTLLYGNEAFVNSPKAKGLPEKLAFGKTHYFDFIQGPVAKELELMPFIKLLVTSVVVPSEYGEEPIVKKFWERFLLKDLKDNYYLMFVSLIVDKEFFSAEMSMQLLGNGASSVKNRSNSEVSLIDGVITTEFQVNDDPIQRDTNAASQPKMRLLNIITYIENRKRTLASKT